MLKGRGRAVPAFYDMPQGTQKARWGGWLVFEAAARRAHRDCQRLPADGLTLTTGGAGGTNPAAGHRRTGGAAVTDATGFGQRVT